MEHYYRFSTVVYASSESQFSSSECLFFFPFFLFLGKLAHTVAHHPQKRVISYVPKWIQMELEIFDEYVTLLLNQR
jgi:hypothetical protein